MGILMMDSMGWPYDSLTVSCFYRYLISMVKIDKFRNKIKCKKNLHIWRKTRYIKSLSVF